MLESCKLRRVRENNKDVEGHLKNCMQFLSLSLMFQLSLWREFTVFQQGICYLLTYSS